MGGRGLAVPGVEHKRYNAAVSRSVERIDVAAGTRRSEPDDVVDEAPLTITARGTEAAVTMRTPGEDLELVRGLLFAEGGAALATRALVQTGPDRVDVDADPGELAPRSFMATAACGVCGKVALAALETRAQSVASELAVPAATLAAIPDALRAAQARFATTGGLHGAGIFDPAGRALAVREDVGRHNALDKVIGWALGAGHVPLAQRVVAVSGRLGYELIEKVVLAGAPIVVAVSAPSSLAVDVAERFNVTLCGFVRGTRLNVYSHGWRVV
jgi:FdhD protein